MREADELRQGEVRRVAACDLSVGKGVWDYAERNRVAALAGFEAARQTHPAYFNGAVQILIEQTLRHDHFAGRFVTTDFASFLYWRENGAADRNARDCFGCAIVRSAEGHILLGIQAAGNLNAGRAYCPSGFIDAADVGADGRIDIDGSTVREIEEETGLDIAALSRVPGYVLVAAGASIAIGVEYRSTEAAAALTERIRANLTRQHERELDDVMFVASLADLAGRPTTPHVLPLLAALL